VYELIPAPVVPTWVNGPDVEAPRSTLKPASSVELSVQLKVSWAASTPVCARTATMNKKQMAKARLRSVFKQFIFVSFDGTQLDLD
jgi:hypothetical protein